ncbi:hypothetical protein [Prescottella equi]|uniref:hypothetical protein n=1 Tax=Rhodococcus hoagii TaxID=43767 RepID=UPI000A100702|nr:hypothetical protein [Prescottella equi]NKR26046.1 hypothetical protein [Prescottella equi]NKR39683.1 hypothetical protein [Prescottella equi]NKR68402.1 hypothetical protein [Prescottella equi]NKR72505.1 hypothetical protein [Prescottella equi]NKR91042.1 hypothetical protein [Prescottella equi]
MRTAVALLAIAAGLVVYVAAFFINAPIEVCIVQPTPPAAIPPGADSVVATPAISSKVWVVLVATRCELTYPATGIHTSDLIVEWGPSAIAVAGLLGAASALWIWLGYRAEEADDV